MTTLTDSNNTETTWSLRKRSAADRGRAEHGWLHARFTFSFAEYFDPDHMGFRSLRVMNNDTIEPQGGFPTHPHKDAEIFTYVISGQLEHRDSMGNGSVITPGNLQYMSAGAGVTHSEFNPSRETQTELYQIWLRPNQTGGEPLYAEKHLGDAAKENALTLLFSGSPKDGATVIRQDAQISFGRLATDQTLTISADAQRPHAWLQVITGEVAVLGETLGKADGLAISDHPSAFEITAQADTQFLLFRLN
jgi:redox-sensitive bicupin YhaK (pirin superfamily)